MFHIRECYASIIYHLLSMLNMIDKLLSSLTNDLLGYLLFYITPYCKSNHKTSRTHEYCANTIYLLLDTFNTTYKLKPNLKIGSFLFYRFLNISPF